MSGSMLHYYFSKDLFSTLDEKYKKQIHLTDAKIFLYANIYDLGNYYKYNNLFKKDDFNISYKMHNKKTKEFLENIIKYTKENGFDKDNVSLIYGLVSHYTLDKYLNPFIYSRSGVDTLSQPNKKYKNKYKKYCEMLDYFFIKKYEDETTFLQLNLNKKFKGAFLLNFNDYNALDYAMNRTYGFSQSFQYFKLSNKKFKSKFNYSKLKSIINKFSKIKTDYLNTEKKEYREPYDGKRVNYTIFELYNLALKEATTLIKAVNDYLYFDKKISFNMNFKDISLYTGYDSEIFNYEEPIDL